MKIVTVYFENLSLKGASFDRVTPQEIDLELTLINNLPRKCLKWEIPHEVFMEKVLRLI